MSERIAICTSEGNGLPHAPLTLYADSADPDFRVLAEQDDTGYHLTNRYSDGTVGISNADRTEAECDEQPICGDCGLLIDHWEDVTS